MADLVPRMTIPVVSGIGRGTTLLSSFDAALYRCGTHNYNLIPLSSVIPPAAEVIIADRYCAGSNEHGHRLYVVKADVRSDEAGKVIGAGIGWYQWGDGRGVFVEHTVIGSSREAVAAELDHRMCRSLRDLCDARDVSFHEQRLRSKIEIAEVDDRPTAVLVLAVYQSQRWA